MIAGVLGAGGIGTLLGYTLAATCDVRVLVRDAEQAEAIARRGGLVLDARPARFVHAAASPGVLSGCDVVLVSLKTFAVAGVLATLVREQPALASVPVVSFSNGADAVEQIAIAFGPGATIALAPTTEAVAHLTSGRARRTARGRTIAGWAAGHYGAEAVLDALLAALAIELDVVREQPIEPHLWAKLVANAAINPVTALAGVCNGMLLERPVLRERAARIARESAAIAGALGVVLPFEDAVAHVEAVARATAPNRSSMLVDLEAGTPTEIEAINGAIVRAAQRVGLTAPENAAARDEVRARRRA